MRGPGAGLTQRTATANVSAGAWIGRCSRCGRDETEVASRREHFERVLCATCAERPASPLLAVPDRPEDHDPGLHRMPDGSTVERDQDGQIVSVYVDGDVWAQWEADRRRRVAKDRADRPAQLADLEAKLAAAGLRPVIDGPLGIVRADCVDCGARSLAIIPRGGKLLSRCDACGVEEVQRV